MVIVGLEDLLKDANQEDYSDPEDFVDNITDEELLADLLAKKPTEEIYKERCLIVFGLPIAPADKVPKLDGLLNKVFTIKGCTHYHEIPLKEDGSSKDYCFVEYPSKELTEAALIVLDGFQLDKVHTFRAYRFSMLDTLKEPEANWKEPQPKEYVDVGDLWWYVQNPKCFDQFAIQVHDRKEGETTTAVYWANNGKDPSNIEARKTWSEHIFKWSPYGTYLATLHKPGVALWGGENFTRCQKFGHENANYIEFSPKESYIVTYAYDDRKGSNEHENSLRIFDTFTGEQKKTFSPSGSQGASGVHSWPFFKWSFDEKFFGFCRPKGNSIFIYDTSSFMINSNKAIEIDGLVTFEWNPAKNLIAYYCEERPSSNAPAEIGIIEFPSREKVRAQRIYSVSAANLFWQKAGNYLAAHTERYNSIRKTKEGVSKLTGVSSYLEIFDFSEKLVAVQSIQLTDTFISFDWEPKGDRFCVLQGSSNMVTPVVYRIEKAKSAPQCISKLEPANQLNTAIWAPQGGWLVVYASGTSAGNVLFIDTNGAEAKKTRAIEHSSVNYGSWDPTGRYFVTASLANNRLDPSYRIHTFQGRELFRKSIDTLTRFKWRPRPPVNLPDTKVREIRRNIKQISQRFEEEDRREQLKLSKDLQEKRREITNKFNERRAEHKQRWEEEKDERAKLRGGIDSDFVDQSDFIEEHLTVVVNTEKVEIQE
ncbi:Eukaryotic translation initiation factor 3 subunit B [Aphelenchoides bicaudatus]|nr:Eukaryotic translation initiation factor 3 subunit B [Aphelenchoides bicaudatus]